MNDVTVVIPTIPPRDWMLERALRSVEQQTYKATAIHIEMDTEGVGASVCRNRAMEHVDTTWVAPLDDDDEFLPHHLERLLATANASDADLVYPQWEGINTHIFNDRIGRPFDDTLAASLRKNNFIPVTTLIRTEALRSVGWFTPLGGENDTPCEDWGAWLKLLDAGYKFVHHQEVTWRWNGHPTHTSGRPWNRGRR